MNAPGSETVSWMKRIVGGHKITFVLDSGAVRSIAPRNLIPNVNTYKTKNTGIMFRVANGEQIPNEGELDLKGRASNGEKFRVKSQVANITRPLAATSEMVGAGNLVIMHKSGGLMEQLSEEDQHKVMKLIEKGAGPVVPVIRKGYAFHVEIEVKSQENQGWSIQARKGSSTIKSQKKIQGGDDMEVVRVCYEQMPYATFWVEEIMAVENSFECTP